MIKCSIASLPAPIRAGLTPDQRQVLKAGDQSLHKLRNEDDARDKGMGK